MLSRKWDIRFHSSNCAHAETRRLLRLPLINHKRRNLWEFRFIITLIMAVIRWITIVVMLMWMLVIEIPIAFAFSLALSDAAAKYAATSLLRIVAPPLWIRDTHLESVLCFSLSLSLLSALINKLY